MLGAVTETTPEEILSFWFGELEDGLAKPETRTRWFVADADFDKACEQFRPVLDSIHDGRLDHWLIHPNSTLAYILACDQLPRNIFRGEAAAFEWDHLGLEAAKSAISSRFDLQLGLDERAFLYLPFEHSENLIDQHTAVGLFSALRDSSTGNVRNIMGNTLRFAHQHREIILKFGRFPHRNKVLNRTSTPEEQSFVDAGDGFGQSPTQKDN